MWLNAWREHTGVDFWLTTPQSFSRQAPLYLCHRCQIFKEKWEKREKQGLGCLAFFHSRFIYEYFVFYFYWLVSFFVTHLRRGQKEMLSWEPTRTCSGIQEMVGRSNEGISLFSPVKPTDTWRRTDSRTTSCSGFKPTTPSRSLRFLRHHDDDDDDYILLTAEPSIWSMHGSRIRRERDNILWAPEDCDCEQSNE